MLPLYQLTDWHVLIASHRVAHFPAQTILCTACPETCSWHITHTNTSPTCLLTPTHQQALFGYHIYPTHLSSDSSPTPSSSSAPINSAHTTLFLQSQQHTKYPRVLQVTGTWDHITLCKTTTQLFKGCKINCEYCTREGRGVKSRQSKWHLLWAGISDSYLQVIILGHKNYQVLWLLTIYVK